MNTQQVLSHSSADNMHSDILVYNTDQICIVNWFKIVNGIGSLIICNEENSTLV